MKPKRILITGASRGLGRAMTESMIALGHTVVGCATQAETVQELNAEFGPPNAFTQVDVSENDEVAAWAESLLANGGPPDLLINNAALIRPVGNLWETSPEEFSRLIDVNIKGVYHLIRHFTQPMIDAGGGVIVNFSSGWGRSVSPEVAGYCATKWAIEGLTQALAAELPTGTAAVALNPGIIHTEMLATCWEDGAAAYPSPKQWAEQAVPFILKLTARDNGRSLTAPS